MIDKMYIIEKDIETKIEIKNSKFICNLMIAHSEEEANKKLEVIKKKYYDARHNCFGYRIGINKLYEKQNDDGEPRGTAGVPILNTLKQNDLTNCISIVTRYFGGILLGSSGLLRAYVESTNESIQQSTKSQIYMGQIVNIDTDYSHFNIIENYLRDFENIYQIKKIFSENINIEYIIEDSNIDLIEKNLLNITNGKININILDKVYFSIFNKKPKIINI